MKRIIAIIMISVFLTSSIATVKVQALPVAIAASSASVMAMIIGLIPYLGVLFSTENDRQTNIANIEDLVSDEMAKTDMTVQELSNYTNANDATANNGTVLQNFLNDNAVMMAMQAGSGDNYVQTYFTGIGQAQLFVKAILAMSAVMLADENLETYGVVTGGTENGYQKWTGYPNSPVLSAIRPYQCIILGNGYTYLLCGEYNFAMQYVGAAWISSYYNQERYPFTMYSLGSGSWNSGSSRTEVVCNSVIQTNASVYTTPYYTNVLVTGSESTITPIYTPLSTPVPYQTSYIWDDTASISVPDVETAMDVMEGTRTVADVIDTYTAEGEIPMTATIAGTLEGVVTAPEVAGEWSKENWTVPTLITTKFPFCIPWDLTNTFSSMVTTAEPPSWQIDFPSNIFIGGGSMTIDFAQFETLAKIVRWSTMILFMIGLMLLSWRLKGS